MHKAFIQTKSLVSFSIPVFYSESLQHRICNIYRRQYHHGYCVIEVSYCYQPSIDVHITYVSIFNLLFSIKYNL